MLPYICKWYNLGYDIEKRKCLSYDYYHNFPNYYNLAIEYYEKVILYAKLKERSNYYINKLQELGHEVIFITAGSSFVFIAPYKISSEYLDKHNIYYDKLIVGAKE